ncbi:MAG: hypothetical protein QM808_00320 [Steroidobacteraceae bacterium]
MKTMALIAALLACTAANAKIVVLDIDLPLDQVAASQAPMKVGDHHRARIFYDDTTIDPKTKIVRVIHMQHFVGKWIPEDLNDVTMPMTESLLFGGDDDEWAGHRTVRR